MVEIRRFEPKDGEAVKKLISQIMDGEFKDEKAAFSFDDLDNLEGSYGKLDEAFFVAEEGKKIVGTIGVKREDERVALIRRIFVAPQYRQKKIGSELLKRAIEFCEEAGYRELVFKTTSKMEGALKFFESRGFHSRAKVPMGRIELLKFTLSLKGNNTVSKGRQ
ncbi:MAG: GNAT family N-acetyltransferase [Candidatus Omnitrophica bacterium]|nr:GNAT family N-acetyltransferase [Candidatus Omnitrophota bacterium]